MPFNQTQRRAALIAQFEKELDDLLEWENQAEKPDLSAIEEVVLVARQRLGQILTQDLIQAQATQLEAEAELPTDPHTGRKLQPKGKKNGSVKPGSV